MLNGLDLFSGIGGLSLALAPWVRPIAYCENDRYAQAVLLSRMARSQLRLAPIWDDVRSLSGDTLRWAGTIDIIYGGFPCQDISAAGLGAGLGGERSRLYWEIHRLARELNQLSFFSKTSQESEPTGSPSWPDPLLISGMIVDGRLYQPHHLEPHTFENVGSFLPRINTPRPCSGLRSSGANRTELLKGAQLWPTPRASDVRGEGAGAAARKIKSGRGANLAGWVKLWPTPTATEYGSNKGGAAGRVGKTRPGLSTLAKMWPTPCAVDGMRGGNHGRGAGSPTLPAQAGGALNPRWVEWLMAYPLGWTVLEDWATQWFLSRRGRRSPGLPGSNPRKDMK